MILKIITIGIVASILCVILKQYKKEYVILVEIATACIIITSIFNLCVGELSSIFEYLENQSVPKELFEILMKGAVICILTKLSADVCKENGNLLISDIIELSGTVVIVLLSLPLLETVIKIALSFAS